MTVEIGSDSIHRYPWRGCIMSYDTIRDERHPETIASSKREHYAHLARNPLSEQSLRKIYVTKVGPSRETSLARFVENVDLLMSGHVSDTMDRMVFDGMASLGQDVVLKYLIGLKIAILLPALHAGAYNRWDDVDLPETVFLLRRLKAMIEVIISRDNTIH